MALHRLDVIGCIVDEEMREIAADFYTHLFTLKGSEGVDQLLQHINAWITDDMGEHLCESFTDDGIETALF